MATLLGLDQTITEFFYNPATSERLQQVTFVAASVFIYVVPLVLLVMFFRSHRDRIVSLKVFVAAILAWQVFSNFLGQFLYDGYGFRQRPFADQRLEELLFERPEKAFPSDHSAVIAAVVIGFFVYKYPKLGWVFLVLGLISSLSRVVIGFHWFGDIVGGWLIGALAVGLVWVLDRPLTKIFEWFIQKLSRTYGRQ